VGIANDAGESAQHRVHGKGPKRKSVWTKGNMEEKKRQYGKTDKVRAKLRNIKKGAFNDLQG